ncbi:MAG: Spy/CpxP family protein refolding chaperone [Xanthobacteraceae bacterium]
MRRGTMLVLGLLVTGVALPKDARAEPRNLPDALLGIITEPIGAILGTVERIARPPRPPATMRSSRPSAPAATQGKPASASAPTSNSVTGATETGAGEPAARAANATATDPAVAAAPAEAPTAATSSTGPATTAVPTPVPRQHNAALEKPADERKGRSRNKGAPRPDREPAQAAPEQSPLGLVGPLAWPSAYEDVIGFTLWPKVYADRLRGHGIGDVLTTIFAPGATSALRSQTEMTRVAAGGPKGAAVTSTASPSSCNTTDNASPNWPTTQIERSIELTSAQRSTLEQLKAAVAEAITVIKATCRDEAAPTPVERVRSMQSKLWAVRDAAILIRKPLARFFDSLSDEQKKQFVVPASLADPRAAMAGRPVNREAIARMCGMPNMNESSMQPIERTLQPTKAQHTSLETLQKKSFEMGQFLIVSCLQPASATPAERLDFAIDRLTAVLFAASNINLAFNDLYNQLSEEQKKKLDAFAR